MRKLIWLMLLASAWSNAADDVQKITPKASLINETSQKYNKVVSYCLVVASAGSLDVANFNILYPLVAIPESTGSEKVVFLGGSSHGTVGSYSKFPDQGFVYHPNKGFGGFDQMIFTVESNGKKYKVIYSVYVGGNVDYGACSAEKGYYELDRGASNIMKILQDGAVA